MLLLGYSILFKEEHLTRFNHQTKTIYMDCSLNSLKRVLYSGLHKGCSIGVIKGDAGV